MTQGPVRSVRPGRGVQEEGRNTAFTLLPCCSASRSVQTWPGSGEVEEQRDEGEEEVEEERGDVRVFLLLLAGVWETAAAAVRGISVCRLSRDPATADTKSHPCSATSTGGPAR
ncbi:unnamed protein product [Pleuronectes platessa]|uniref:Uncharacterized protein n=1 Tax=Pleuronectes platessa TaxID=8262 RepID=A0A9N7UG29_PLEPL|nr:unnamed protein product [Pleuronectes platessa]